MHDGPVNSKTQHQIVLYTTLLPNIYNDFCWLATDLHCHANSQNWQIVDDGPAYNQCIL